LGAARRPACRLESAVKILLLSTYELGHQPLGLAWPAAHLTAAGHQVACNDLAVEPLDEQRVRAADLIGISVPMHTATRLGVRLSERVRRLNPAAHLCLYGLYASLNADTLLGRYADSVIGGEFEQPLVRLAAQLAERPDLTPRAEGVITLAAAGGVFLGRQEFLLPRRDLLPPLERYAHLDDGRRHKVAGYVEASRGCAHRCRHCPITPVYGGRLRIVQPAVVLEDIRQLVKLGAEHITFGDPDFFNGIKHSAALVRALHAEFPSLSYDVTIKIEHLLEHAAYLPLLRETGCAFVVSAVESVDDRVLQHLQKGHTAADVETALALAARQGLVLRPTFVPFTPWTSLAGYLALLEFVERHDLIRRVAPVQLSIRLLVPSGSSLLGTPALDQHLEGFDPASLTHVWRHPDPRVDALQARVVSLVERATRERQDEALTFDQIVGEARAALGGPSGALPARPARRTTSPGPRLTEAWFC
jgi:radical SAM superfamily enzyme YgiQ (UPF0313 family)